MYFDNADMWRYLMSEQQVSGMTWLSIGLVAAYLWVTLYRQEMVTSWILFRLGSVLLALAIVVPSFVTGVTMPIVRMNMSVNSGFESVLVQGFISCLAPAFMAGSFMCLLSAVAPRRSTLRQREAMLAAPSKHPLDE